MTESFDRRQLSQSHFKRKMRIVFHVASGIILCCSLRSSGANKVSDNRKTTGGFFLFHFCGASSNIIEIVDANNISLFTTYTKPDQTNTTTICSTIMKGANIILYLGLAAIGFPIVSWEYVEGFQPSPQIQNGAKHNPFSLSAFKVSVDELEKDLTPGERSVTGVVRKCGPSVALIRSVLPSASSTTTRTRRRRRTRRAPPRTRPTDENLPRGSDLGSGSGFLVSSEGYICTNFHVIEQAYAIRRNAEMAEQAFDELAGNLTGGIITHDLLNITKSLLQQQFQGIFDADSLPVVYAKISSSNRFQKCRIVDVNPDIDLAVLKIMDESSTTTTENSIAFGSSGDLLVGQTVVAIGNPFGLQSSVSCGVVSALDRQLANNQRPANIPIRNAIQTDAAINPGNSGGPLLNLKGEVVGINTAIITTSGSSAGIGFAVPSDQIQPVVQRILQKDQIENGVRPNMGWLGISVVTQSVVAATPSVSSNSSSGDTNTTSVVQPPLVRCKNWIESVEPNSPAEAAELQPLVIKDGVVEYGDAIVAVGGNQVSDFEELRAELEKCVVGEQVALTVQDSEDKKRVVYATLSRKPTA